MLLTSEDSPPALPSLKVSPADITGHSPNTVGRAREGGKVTTTAGSRTSSSGGGGGAETNLFATATLGFSAVENAVSAEQETSPAHTTEQPLPPITLYDYLVELIGESLILSLSAAARQHTVGRPLKPHLPKACPDMPRTNASNSNRSLETFLSREGFRPIHVQLPQRPAPPPSVPRGYYKGREPWTFNVPQSVLPVHANVLAQRRRRTVPPPHVQERVVKGRCSGHHRCHTQCPTHMNIASNWI